MNGFLDTKEGIVPAPKSKRIKSILCRHRNTVSGVSCSPSGLRRISGEDWYSVCENCGKVVAEYHSTYR